MYVQVYAPTYCREQHDVASCACSYSSLQLVLVLEQLYTDCKQMLHDALLTTTDVACTVYEGLKEIFPTYLASLPVPLIILVAISSTVDWRHLYNQVTVDIHTC